jgi:hypothetical protein
MTLYVPLDIIKIVASYLVLPKYKFLDWIDGEMIEWTFLSANPHPHAITLLKQNYNMIDWYSISKNHNAGEIILNHLNNNGPDDINWYQLCENTSDIAMDIIERTPERKIWMYLAKNPNNKAICMVKKCLTDFETMQKENEELGYDGYLDEIHYDEVYVILNTNPNDNALDMLIKRPEFIYYDTLSCNSNDKAIKLLLNNVEHIDWNLLSKNSNDGAIDILIANPDKINWDLLSENSNDRAIDLLIANPDRINWNNISDNTNIRVMELLRKHIDSIPKVENNIYWLWPCLFVNPNIFEIDVLSYNNVFNDMVCKIDIV